MFGDEYRLGAEAVWQGRGPQFGEVDVSRLGIGCDQGPLGVSASVANGRGEQIRGLAAGGGGLKPLLCIHKVR